MKQPEPDLTPEQLELAFRQLRRPGRPATLQGFLDHPTLRPALLGMARSLSRAPFGGQRTPPRTPPGAPPLPPTPTAPPARRGGAQPGGFRLRPMSAARVDRKRAAANDRDDD